MKRYLLEQLWDLGGLAIDTGDLEVIEANRPVEVTTNPSLITAQLQREESQAIVEDALRWARPEAGASASPRRVVELAADRVAIELAVRILALIPGRVAIHVDPRLSHDAQGTLVRARRLIRIAEDAGTAKERILCKIAGTWAGISAARQLETEGVHTDVTLVFGLHQAVAAAQAGVTAVSPYVGRVLDWHRATTGRDHFPPGEDPGVLLATQIYNYFRRHGHATQVVAGSFRSVDEIKELAGCDVLSISPPLLRQLRETRGDLTRRLDRATAAELHIPALEIDEATFAAMHEADAMATEKLAEGITGFSKAIGILERLLEDRLALVEGRDVVQGVARTMFQALDLDGDGFISREEWAGTEAVFDAIDSNRDGRITAEEIVVALGAVYLTGT